MRQGVHACCRGNVRWQADGQFRIADHDGRQHFRVEDNLLGVRRFVVLAGVTAKSMVAHPIFMPVRAPCSGANGRSAIGTGVHRRGYRLPSPRAIVGVHLFVILASIAAEPMVAHAIPMMMWTSALAHSARAPHHITKTRELL